MINIVKLVTGEELIGTVDISGGFLHIDKPCILHVMPSRTNPEQHLMAMLPYANHTKNHKIKVSEVHVIFVEEPVQELYNQYNTLFGSGLVVPNNTNVVDFNKFK